MLAGDAQLLGDSADGDVLAEVLADKVDGLFDVLSEGLDVEGFFFLGVFEVLKEDVEGQGYDFDVAVGVAAGGVVDDALVELGEQLVVGE